jgi:hypothetical protein
VIVSRLSVSKSCLGAGYTTRRCAGRRSRCAIASTEERTDRGDEEHGERRDGSVSMWLKVQGGFMFSLGWRVRQTAVIGDDDLVLVAVVGWLGDVS